MQTWLQWSILLEMSIMWVKWSRDRRRHVTMKGQGHDPNMLRAQYLENSWRCYLATYR